MQHCSYLAELFNHIPQSSGLGLTSTGAYLPYSKAFFGNVVLEALGVVNPDTVSRIYGCVMASYAVRASP